MRVIITGARGQLGQALAAACTALSQPEILLWNRPQYDVADPAISLAIAQAAPDVVINAAAWTDVDGAEMQPDAAYAVNALGPAYMAEGCARSNALLVHVSTNEVFPGEDECVYREYDATRAGSVYARSKLAGERAATQRHRRTLIARVAWLFGRGGQNFPAKITAAADRHGALRVVADEYGNPTYAPDAAAAIMRLIEHDRPGIYHVVNAGQASRLEFAQAVLRANGRSHIPLTPIASTEWSRTTTPPLHAVLVNQTAAALGVRLRSWQDAIEEYVRQGM